MDWLMIAAVVLSYIAGAGFTNGAMGRIAENNNRGSFSGDYVVDMFCVVAWPLMWLLYLPHLLGKAVFT